jgi:hypothetical protein
MSSDQKPICWICRENQADTGEHKTKRSDLKALLGSHGGPFYYHDPNRANQIVQSISSRLLKSAVPICANCNNARTQPHDLAWEWMSGWLRTHSPPLRVGNLVRANRIFHHDTRKQMLNVHLYFVKLFGSMICEGLQKGNKIPIDVAPFADAIMKNKPHPEVFLQFGIGSGTIGRSNLDCWIRSDGKSVIALWTYWIGSVAVNILYMQQGERWENLDLAWNPSRRPRKRLKIIDARTEFISKRAS